MKLTLHRSSRNAVQLWTRALLFLAFVVAMFGPAPAQGSHSSAQNPPTGQTQDEKDKQEKSKKDDTAGVPTPLPRGKKLVLKDGTFHIVRSYEKQGDRVRYYSVERSAWEEIPTDLVDWPATAKVEAENAKKNEELAEKVRQRQAMDIAEDVDVGSSIEISPGLFLPDGEGIWAVQDKLILPLTQTLTETKLNKGSVMKQILVPVPIIPTKHRIEMAGKRAVLRLSTPSPEFYFRTADGREPEMELVRAEVKGETRQVGVIATNTIGDSDEQRKYIPMQKWKVAHGVYRFTVSQALEVGEYAISEILADGMNMYVWDFGIDPPGSPAGPDPKVARKPAETQKPKQ